MSIQDYYYKECFANIKFLKKLWKKNSYDVLWIGTWDPGMPSMPSFRPLRGIFNIDGRSAEHWMWRIECDALSVTQETWRIIGLKLEKEKKEQQAMS